jgi:integrase
LDEWRLGSLDIEWDECGKRVVDHYEVQHLLGHTQAKTTERYVRLQQDTLMTAANVVANLAGTAAPQLRPVVMIGG